MHVDSCQTEKFRDPNMVPPAERHAEPCDVESSADMVTLYVIAASAERTPQPVALDLWPANWRPVHHDRRATDA
jgi:hypothetical protein